MRVTEALSLIVPEYGRVSRGVLSPSPHCVGPQGSSWQVSLDWLDELLERAPLDPLVPEALRLAVRKRQIAYVGGRLCAEQALCALGAGITEVGRSKHGAPIWPAGTIGSIAHTGSHAYAAAASSHRQLGVGIDSEFVVPHMFEAIAGVCCTSRERTRWLNEHREPVLATLIFSAKESFYKAIEARVRRFVDFQEVEVVSHDAVRQQLSLEVDSSDLRQLVRSAPVQYRVDGTTVHTTVLLVD